MFVIIYKCFLTSTSTAFWQLFIKRICYVTLCHARPPLSVLFRLQ